MSRAAVAICEGTGTHLSNAKIVATAGGTFTGWISTLGVATRGGFNVNTASRQPRGTLDLAAMDSCDIDIVNLLVAPGLGMPEALGSDIGVLRLPPGTATVSTAVIGAVDGAGSGVLSFSNTVMSVTNAITIRATGSVTARIDTTPSGLAIANSDDEAFVVVPGGTLTLDFCAPHMVRPHYGFKWQGDHLASVLEMIDDGRIVIETTGLNREVDAFRRDGATMIGLRNTGTMFMLR